MKISQLLSIKNQLRQRPRGLASAKGTFVKILITASAVLCFPFYSWSADNLNSLVPENAAPETSNPTVSPSEFMRTVLEIQKESEETKRHLLFESRNQRIYHHGTKQPCAVLMLHGLYQSPKDQESLAQHFYKMGCNVLAPLLKGHWARDPQEFYKISEIDWILQSEASLQKVLELGDKILVVGHSTGALLALHLGLLYPEKINSLILFSPAIKLRYTTRVLSEFGALWGLDRMGKTGIDFEYDSYKKPAIAGVYVNRLIAQIFLNNESTRTSIYKSLRIRTLIFSTEEDDVISHSEILALKNKNSERVELMEFPRFSGVFHDNIQRGPLDVVSNSPKSWQNPFFKSVLEEIDRFLANSLF